MVHSQTRGNKVDKTEQISSRLLENGRETSSNSSLQLCEHTSKPCRCRVAGFQGTLGLQSHQGIIFKDVRKSPILSESGPFCEPKLSSTSSVCDVETHGGSTNDRCFLNQMGTGRLPVSSSTINSSLSAKDCSGQMSSFVGLPSLVNQHLLVTPAKVDSLETVPSPIHKSLLNGPRNEKASNNKSESTSGFSSRRQSLVEQGFNLDTANMIESDIRSLYQYSLKWNKFKDYCESHNYDPISCPISVVCNFLQTLNVSTSKYRTISTFRSVISKYHEPVEGFPVGKHPTVLRLIKSVFLKKPPIPKYIATWPLSVLINYLRSLPPAEDLDLSTLAKKTATLIRLSTNSRSSFLCLLDRNPIFEVNKITFQLIDLEKQARPNHLRGWVTCAVTNEKALNVAHHVKVYLQRTDQREESCKTLFVSISKPHKAITTATTFAKWTLDLMTKSGVDTEVFKTHSTRSAVPAVLVKSLSLDQILKRTDWSNVNTFNTFYSKQVVGEEEEGDAATGGTGPSIQADPLLLNRNTFHRSRKKKLLAKQKIVMTKIF